MALCSLHCNINFASVCLGYLLDLEDLSIKNFIHQFPSKTLVMFHIDAL